MSPPSRPRAPRLHLLRAAASCSILVGALACEDRGTTAGGSPEGEVQDSAGIRIVSHRLGQPAGAGALVLALDTIPELKVGVAEGDSTLELAGVVGAVLLDDGRLAIGLRGNSQVRLYSTEGVLERRTGRRGSGPGEFRRIAGLWRLADGDLAVDDAGARQISVFDTAGALRRSISYAQPRELDTAATFSRVVGFVADGLGLGIAEHHSPSRTGVSRPLIDLVVLDSSGLSRKIAGPYPGTEMFLGPPKGGFALMATPPFARRSLTAANSGTVAFADNALYEIRLMTSAGRLKTIIRADVSPENVSDADIRQYAADQAAIRGGQVTDEAVASLREMTVHERLPVLESLLLDDAGSLYVQEFARPGANMRRVAVYSMTGASRGAFELPTDVDLLSADGDRLVVLSRDSDGAEVVEIIRLVSRR